MTTRSRHFGYIRKRPSGRWQALYWHEGHRHSSGTLATKADAQTYLATIEADLRRGAWIDPRAGQITLHTYAEEWLERRPDLAVRTDELYRYLLTNHILPTLGQTTLAGLQPSKIRGWNSVIAKDHPSTAAKAYRLLSTIMRTAVVDGLILTSPCKVDGAGTERAAERPLATFAEIDALTNAMPEHLQLVVLLATWCQLRRGEVLGLRRKDIDLMHATIKIEQSRTFTMDGQSLTKEPKTVAGRRSLSVPGNVTEAIIRHLNQFTDVSPDALVFTGRTGMPLSRNVLRDAWDRARLSVGRPDLHLHDLRHTGLTLAAATGATTAELMHRAGHSSVNAALRYQHATRDRDRVLADALEALVKPATVTPIDRESRVSE